MKKLFVFLLLLVPVLFGLFLFMKTREGGKVIPENSKEMIGKTSLSQTSDEGQVIVEVKPKLLEAGKEAVFEITFTTHSVELDFDLVLAAKLKDDQGKEIQAVSWSGGRGGHHLSGDLKFPALAERTKSVELIMADIDGSERSFRWDL